MMEEDILHEVMRMAQTEGCNDVKIVLSEKTADDITVLSGKVDKMQHATIRSLSLNLFIDGRDGYFYTNRVSLQGMRDFIRKAVEATRMLESDIAQTLPDPARYYRGGGVDLRTADPLLPAVTPQEKTRLALACNQEIAGKHPALISADTRYSDHYSRLWYLVSNGFEGFEQNSSVSLTTICTVDGVGGQHPMDGWGESRICFAGFPWEGISRKALDRTLRKIGQHPIASGHYQLLVESPVADHLLQPMLAALSGQALQQQMSFLANCQGQQVGSPLLDLVDDPLIPGTRGASYFDYDGVALERRSIFSKGRLCTYFIDTPNSHRLGMPATTQCAHHLIFTPGADTLDDLLCKAGDAILVTDFNGGNCDPSTGNFSYGIEGFHYKDGIWVEPVSGINVTGNMLHLWQHLVGVANDADPWNVDLIPSLLFEDISFGGTAG